MRIDALHIGKLHRSTNFSYYLISKSARLASKKISCFQHKNIINCLTVSPKNVGFISGTHKLSVAHTCMPVQMCMHCQWCEINVWNKVYGISDCYGPISVPSFSLPVFAFLLPLIFEPSYGWLVCKYSQLNINLHVILVKEMLTK